MVTFRRARTAAAICVAAMTLLLSACGLPGTASTVDEEAAPTSPEPLLIYSVRNESLVSRVLGELEKAVGSKVEVRYGNTAELAAQLLEEGPGTAADLYFSQDAGALGALGQAGLLAPLDSALTDRVLPQYVDTNGLWAATTARARVIIYNPGVASEVQDFTRIDQGPVARRIKHAATG